MVNIPGAVIGVMILFIGRKLFWLFVGSIGLLAGLTYAERFLGPREDIVILAVSLGIGILFATCALLLKRIAVGLAGFTAGAYLTLHFVQTLGVVQNQFVWLVCLGGGVLGIVLLSFLFDWAVILISSLLGAVIVTQSVSLDPAILPWAFFGMILLGCAAQARIMYAEPGRRG